MSENEYGRESFPLRGGWGSSRLIKIISFWTQVIFKRILARKFILVGSGKQPTNMGLQEGKYLPANFS
jgi:hypothetical protein